MATDIERIIRHGDKKVFLYKGVTRTYLDYFPDITEPLPLVVILHGGGANAENAFRMADMEELADKEGFGLLYPDGSGESGDRVYTWNAGNCCGFSMENNCDDVGFLESLIAELINCKRVDSDKIYMAGFSNGGMFAHRFASEKSHIVSAFACIAGAMNYDSVMPNDPISVLIMHGKEDGHAPYLGGYGHESRYHRKDKSVRDGLAFWVEHNKCQHMETRDVADYRQEVYENSTTGHQVVLYTFNSMGHAWPGGRMGLRYGNVDEPSKSVKATEVIWDFFRRQPNKEECRGA